MPARTFRTYRRTGKVPPMTSVTPHALSANENPYPPLPSVQELLRNETSHINRYPDRFSTDVIAAISEHLSVPTAHIATGAGSVGVTLHLLHSLLGTSGGEIAYAWPSFEAYPHLTQICGGRSTQVPLAAGHVHDLDALAGAVTESTKAVIVCNPNNPTGTVVRRAELERFLDRVPAHVPVILDEAYREFVRDTDVPDGIELYRERPQLIVLRTFSKAYGLAGLRIGYAVAHEQHATAIRKAAVPFGVTGMAQAAAVASLRAEDELMGRVEELVKERHRLQSGLRDLGLELPTSQANFLWLPLGERTTAFAEACAARAVLVRAFPDEGVRVTVGTPEANDLVLQVAAAFAPGA
ncbi:histidinol-phosphate transaminase [Streptomyces sp. NPDC006879]|uniref:histidinol-phosphate transaminase n=1 Tax=Streptomyces sp. NPDC006879 TaxID=3364767 RepID=UPI00369FCF33